MKSKRKPYLNGNPPSNLKKGDKSAGSKNAPNQNYKRDFERLLDDAVLGMKK